MNRENYILTGPPRSGTTLACYLLNKVPNTVALHEPMNLRMFPDSTSGLKSIADFFIQMRLSLLKEGKALSKASGSTIPDNPFTQEIGTIRQSIVQKDWVYFEKALSEDFHLVLKQNAHFTFLLDELVQLYSCAAIIRNPVSIIASWNTIQAPVARGTLTVLQTLNPALHRELEAIPDLLQRQIRLLDALFRKYVNQPGLTILKYEDMISSGGASLQNWIPDASILTEPLQNRNRSALYSPESLERIKQGLSKYDGAWLTFYSKEQIANV